jgi:rhodanese-related sulfurtransferase
MPEPAKLLKKSSKWSDSSDSGSNEKIAKPLAVRGKFVFDPENGGGRRRRDKHLSRQKF